jgi:hypothetical protein
MAKAKRMDYDEISAVILNFTKAASAKYDGPAFSTGYLGSMLAGMVANMSVAKQAGFVAMLNSSSVYTPFKNTTAQPQASATQ